jgi:hypothetical protein
MGASVHGGIDYVCPPAPRSRGRGQGASYAPAVLVQRSCVCAKGQRGGGAQGRRSVRREGIRIGAGRDNKRKRCVWDAFQGKDERRTGERTAEYPRGVGGGKHHHYFVSEWQELTVADGGGTGIRHTGGRRRGRQVLQNKTFVGTPPPTCGGTKRRRKKRKRHCVRVRAARGPPKNAMKCGGVRAIDWHPDRQRCPQAARGMS